MDEFPLVRHRAARRAIAPAANAFFGEVAGDSFKFISLRSDLIATQRSVDEIAGVQTKK